MREKTWLPLAAKAPTPFLFALPRMVLAGSHKVPKPANQALIRKLCLHDSPQARIKVRIRFKSNTNSETVYVILTRLLSGLAMGPCNFSSVS